MVFIYASGFGRFHDHDHLSLRRERLTSDFGIDVYSGHYLSSGRLGRFGPTHFNLEEKRASPTVAQIEPAERGVRLWEFWK